MEKTPDGSWLLVAEGGALAFLDAGSGGSFEQEAGSVERVPIGRQGVVPVELRLDPEANFGNEYPAAMDLVYIAGGRDGFWMMEAHPDPNFTLKAVRVDDSLVPGQDHDSARWCSAVDIIELGEERYLAVLFSARSDNRLRLYPLDEVRSYISANELGAGVLPAVEILVERPVSAWSPTAGTNGFAEAFGYGMDVHGSHVYVTLGTHGLVRIEFHDPEDLEDHEVVAGPVLGAGSHYELAEGALFGDLVYWRNFSGSTPSQAVRSHPPFFVDVVAYTYDETDYVVATVDHLGWVRFDVTLGFDEELEIEHHEGTQYAIQTYFDGTSGVDQLAISLAEDEYAPGDEGRTFARRLDLCWTPSGPALGVAASAHPIWIFPGIHNEGRQLGPQAELYAGIPVSITDVFRGQSIWTLLYRLHPLSQQNPLVTLDRNAVFALRAGGGHVKVVRIPPVGGGEGPIGGFSGGGPTQLDKLKVFTGRVEDTIGVKKPSTVGLFWDPDEPDFISAPVLEDSEHANLMVQVIWRPAEQEGDHAVLGHRESSMRPGAMIRDIGPSLRSPELLIPASNDSGLAGPGHYVVCDDEIGVFPVVAEFGASHGIIHETGSQWEPLITMPDDGFIVWGDGNGYRATVMHGGDPCAFPPDAPRDVKQVRFWPLPDRFGATPRTFLTGAGPIDPAYDAHTRNLGGEQDSGAVLFVNAVSTADGITALWRDQLDEKIENASVGLLELVALEPRIDIGKLDTHPEYENVPHSGSGVTSTFLTHTLAVAPLLQTYFSNLTQLHGPESQARDRWALVVPSGSVHFPWDHPYLENHSLFESSPGDAWVPANEILEANDHLMVRVFDVTNPNVIKNLSSQNAPSVDVVSYTLIGPSARSHAIRLEVVDFDDRTWCFVADFGGGVVVFELTDILDEEDGAVLTDWAFEAWQSPPSISDNLPTNVFSLITEQVEDELYVYVSVWRHGLAVLRFKPEEPKGSRLEHVRTIQTPGSPSGLSFREVNGERQLIVADGQGGFRVLRRADVE